MTALFNKDTDLVGWLSNDKKNIFDTDMKWVAFVASDTSVWNVSQKNWCGHLYGNNIRDCNGKTLFWNPDTPISNTLKSYKPYTPYIPTSYAPYRPSKPYTLIADWPTVTWNDFIGN